MAALGRIAILDEGNKLAPAVLNRLTDDGYEWFRLAVDRPDFHHLSEEGYDLLLAALDTSNRELIGLLEDFSRTSHCLPIILMAQPLDLPALDRIIQSPCASLLLTDFRYEDLQQRVRLAVERGRIGRALDTSHRRVRAWCRDLEALATASSPASSSAVSLSADAFLKLAVVNLTGILEDIQELAEALCQERLTAAACRHFECPHRSVMAEGLLEAIDTLKRTKDSFRSRDLGDLRQKLESLLHREEDTPDSAA